MAKKTCDVCGEGFKSRVAHAKRCSKACRDEAHRRNNRTAPGIPQAEELPPDDHALIAAAEARGYVIHKPEPPAPLVETIEVDISRVRGDRVKVGIVSDTHFGSKFQQPTYLVEHLLYMKDQRDVSAILVPGDVTDGSTKMHAGFEYELWAHGADAQVDYAVETLPEIGVPYYFIAGNHDYSHYRSGGNDVVKAICAARDDFHYLSPGAFNSLGSVGYVSFGNVSIQMCHPHLGSTRTRSYRMERWVEELAPERKPNIVVMGNFHKVLHTDYRNVAGLMVPSYQSQSTWMAAKGISSYIGGAVLEFGSMDLGLASSLSVEWLVERVPHEHDYPGGA